MGKPALPAQLVIRRMILRNKVTHFLPLFDGSVNIARIGKEIGKILVQIIIVGRFSRRANTPRWPAAALPHPVFVDAKRKLDPTMISTVGCC